MTVDVAPGPDPRHGEAGFTLVEVLVALTLMSFLGVALFGSLRFGVLAWERGTTHADAADRILVTQSFLRQVVAESYPLYLREDPTKARVDFDGAAASLSFLTTSPAALGAGGRARVTLSGRPGPGGTDLVMSARQELSSAGAAGSERILVPDIEALELSYFGIARGDRIATWHDRWTGQLALPQLVRIRVTYPGQGGARLWPELLVAPRIAVDVGCIHDALTKRCRGR